MAKKSKGDVRGITAEKDEFMDWFSQIMVKADLADYTKVSGCVVFKPTAWAMWETIRELVDARLKKLGVSNVYFPMFIPESLLLKEQEHVKGFTPEVAWVTHAGGSKLSERLAVRPTSEAIMYDSFAKWIRSWRDLPLLYNQWSNVVRWEFKHPVPFMRTREFFFNEGHTVYADKASAEKEKEKIIGMYKDVCENYLALPGLIGKKTDKEKFAGAEYTYTIEYYMPNGKAIQGPDFHHDGQNFAKAYGITFLNKEGKEELVYQNTWAISTRMLGVMFAMHSDEKGLVLPPRMAPKKVVIMPILFEKTAEKVMKKVRELEKSLEKFGAVVDDRKDVSPGNKFNKWEMMGVPLRIEIGPKDLEKNSAVIVRRDNGKKEFVKTKDLPKRIEKLCEEIQDGLFKKAQKLLYDNIVEVNDYEGLEKAIKEKKICLIPICSSTECEDELKYKSGGVKILNIPDNQPKKKSNCVVCGKGMSYWAYAGKSY